MKSLGCFIVLCCIFFCTAIKSNNPNLPSKEKCGQQADSATGPNDFPWVLFVPLQSRVNNPDANVRCAGTLISKRYVLIAKSCLQFVLSKVVVGRYDTSDKNESVVEIDVESKEVPDTWEVVLLRLAKEVKDDIQPVCLPFDDFKRPEVGDIVYTSGWGLTKIEGKNSPTKKKIKETLLSNEECKQIRGVANANDDKTECIKLPEDSPALVCAGDEGSPILYSSNGNWVADGILTSVYGANGPCTVNPSGVRITNEILQWISDNVKA